MIRSLIAWAVRRTDYSLRVPMVTFGGSALFKRYEFLWRDERMRVNGTHVYRPPWWRPFNAFLHCWRPAPELKEAFHDHQRWTITVCLCGKLVEHTPWGERSLTPGSIVIRTHKAIHAFSVPAGYRHKTWTLFIVGRKNHGQNTYEITPRLKVSRAPGPG